MSSVAGMWPVLSDAWERDLLWLGLGEVLVVRVAGVSGDVVQFGEGEFAVTRQRVDEGGQEQGGSEGVPERAVGLAAGRERGDGLGQVMPVQECGQPVAFGARVDVAG